MTTPIYPLIAAIVCTTMPLLHSEDSVKIYETSRKTDAEERRIIQLSAPMVSFDINATVINHSNEDTGDLYTAAVSVNDLPTAPTLAFNVTGDQFTLARQPYTIELLDRESNKKGLRAKWQLPGGEVVLTLVANDEADPVLYGRIEVQRSQAFQITLLLAPGGHAPESETRDRWVFVEEQDIQHSEESLPLTSNWLLLYDKLLDPEIAQNGKGAVGFLWNENPGAKVSFQCGAYISTLSVSAMAGSEENSFDFILWPFTGIPNESAKEQLKERAAALLDTFSENRNQIFNENP